MSLLLFLAGAVIPPDPEPPPVVRASGGGGVGFYNLADETLQVQEAWDMMIQMAIVAITAAGAFDG